MKRQANRDDPAYRDKKINEEYKRRNNPKRPTEGELLRESGGYLKDPETEIDTSQPLQSSTNPLDDLTINKGKFRDDARQKKIRDLSEKPGTEAEGQAARRKLKDQTDLPQFFQVTDPQAEELSEYDEKMRQAGELSGQEKIEAIKKANRSRPDWATKSAEFLSEVWEDTKEWKEWYRPGANLGALGARGLEAFFTFESDDIQSLSWEALDKLLGTKGIGMSIIKEIPIIKDQVLPVLARRLSVIKNSLNRQARWIKGELQPALATVDGGTGNFKTYEPLQMSGSGGGGTSKALRSQKSKFSKGMVYNSTIELGGTPVDAKRIWEYQQKQHTDIKKTVSLLNEIYQIYEPHTRISIRNGKLSFIPRKRIGSNLADRSPLYKKSWQFDKDHIRAVINQFGPMEGADMAENLEIIFGSLNRKKSNVFELPAEILDELGVPKNIDEFVFKQLHPEYAQLQNKIPNRWKESFSKNILNDYYEKLYGSATYKSGMEPIVSKKKWPAIMKRLVRKYKRVYSDKNLLKQLEEMESIPFWKRIKPNEIPRWAQTLDMPPSPKDPFWLKMPPKSQQRWKLMVKDKYRLRDAPLPHERGLRVEGSKEKYYNINE